MTTETANNIEPEMKDDNLSFESTQISSDEQLSQIIDSINLAVTSEEANTDESQSKSSTTRPTGQTAIGAKLVKKLETLGRSSFDSFLSLFIRFQRLIPKKINQQPNNLHLHQARIQHREQTIMNQTHVGLLRKLLVGLKDLNETIDQCDVLVENIMKNLNDPDQQKNLLTLATKIAELQEQNRLIQAKTNEIEKRSTIYMRERDQALLENGRSVAAKAKLESLCRELHRHNQQIRV